MAIADGTSSPAGDRLGAWLRSHDDDLVGYLRDLVRIPSDNPPGECSAIAARVEEEFRRFGIDVERHDVPRESGPPAPTVLGWLGERTPVPGLLLNAHADVIPPGDGWSVDPYGGVVVDGRVVGRGAAVSKSDVASYTYALAAVGETYGVPAASAVVAVTADEETGGEYGPGWLVSGHGLRPRLAICAGFSHGVVVAHSGCVRGTFVVHGRSAHAAMPWNGVDGIEVALAVLARLYAVHAALASQRSPVAGIERPTLVATGIRGGGAPGATAGVVEIEIDRRILPADSTGDALAQLHGLAEELTRERGVEITFEPTLVAEPLRQSDGQEEIVRAVREEGPAILGHELEAHGVPIFTDARWFSGVGVPTVLYGAGPADAADARGHGPDENVAIDDLICATEVVARVIHRLTDKGGS